MNQDEMTMPRCDVAELRQEVEELQTALSLVLDLFLSKCPEYESWVKMNLPSQWQAWVGRQNRD